MMKKIISFLIVLALALSLGVSALAEKVDFIIDMQDKLWDEEMLELQAQELYDKYGLAFTYLSCKDLQGLTGAELSQKLYAQYFGVSDGVMLLDCNEAVSYYIYCTGAALEILDENDGSRLINALSSAVSYDEGIKAYLAAGEAILDEKIGTTKTLVLLDDLTQSENSPEQPLLSLDGGSAQPDAAMQQPQSPQIPTEHQLPLVVDTVGVVEPALVAELNNLADALSKKYACDTALAFITSTGGKSIQAYADDFYDYNGYGYGPEDNGILLMVAVEDRSFALSTYGPAAYTFSDYGQVYMDEAYIPYLRNSDWYGAAEAYLQVCQELLEYELVNGRPYDVDSEEQESYVGMQLLMSLAAGFVLAFIPIGVMKRKMLNVRKQEDAADYVKSGSFHLSRSYDRFITSRVTKVPIPKNTDNDRSGGGGGSSFHVSSSGRSHGGHSGRF